MSEKGVKSKTVTLNFDDSLIIGENIRVTALRAGFSRVKLAVSAPRNIEVNRAEISLKKKMKNHQT